MKIRAKWTWGAAAVAGVLGVASAQGQTAAVVPPTEATSADKAKPAGLESYRFGWVVRVEPRAWWVSPSGSVKMPGTPSSGNGGTIRMERLNLDTPRFGPYGEVTISGLGVESAAEAGGWRLTFSGAEYSLERDQTTADIGFQLGNLVVSAGQSLRTAFDMTIIEAAVGYEAWRYDFKANSERPEEAFDAIVSTFFVGGVRLYDLGVTVERNLAPVGSVAKVDSQQVFIEPFAGVRFEAELARDFEADFQVTAGGMADSDKSSVSLDIQIAFAWRPWDQVGIQIGWRQIAYQLTDGSSPREFEYIGRMAGLFAGVTVRF